MPKLIIPEHMRSAFMKGFDPDRKTPFQQLVEQMVDKLLRMPEEQRAEALAELRLQVDHL